MSERAMAALYAMQRDVLLSDGEITQLLGLPSRTWVSVWMEIGDIDESDVARLQRWHAYFLRRWPDLSPAERRRKLTVAPVGQSTLLEQMSPANPDADLPLEAEGATCGTTALVPPPDMVWPTPDSGLYADQIVHLSMPRMIGTRDAVRDEMAEQKVPEELDDKILVVLCADMTTGSRTAADELVVSALLRRRALKIGLVGAPSTFREHVDESLAQRDLGDRLLDEVPVWMVP